MRTENPTIVPARMLAETLYCERLVVLEWAQGEFVDNEFTVHGRAVHRRADKEGGQLPEPASTDSDEEQDAPTVARSVWLTSAKLGITAKIDVVEAKDGTVTPVEYKRGKRHPVPEEVRLPQRAQVCAQVLLLREHGYECEYGVVYFAGDRKRVRVVITEELISITINAAQRALELVGSGTTPPPLLDSPKCNGCSLVPICLPDEVHWIKAHSVTPPRIANGPRPSPEDLPKPETPVRRLHPARDDKVALYVQEHGARIGISGDCLKVKSREGTTTTARIPNTSHVNILGNGQVSTQALCALMRLGIPVCYFSQGGWYIGRASGVASNNIDLRIAQFRAADDKDFCLDISRSLVNAKIRNCRTMLRRNGTEIGDTVLFSLKQAARKAREATSLESLLGIEGSAARLYFGSFTTMFKTDEPNMFELTGRNRRPPRDPVNALLSFVYALLAKEHSNALAAAGLDPQLGFYHQPRFGRPALALDLMEEMRPIVGDSVVVSLINNRVVSKKDFEESPVSVVLRSAARRRVIAAFERRMDQLVTHPVFGYRISYRRVFSVQARLMGRLLLGEINTYPSFRTR